MDLQACIQLVNAYTPTDPNPQLLLAAVQQMIGALTTIDRLGDGLRPLLKALVTAAPHLPAEWENILENLRRVLASPAVPWPHRAFLLKSLPAMLSAGETRRGATLCELLLHWCLPPPQLISNENEKQEIKKEEESLCPNPQERRVALTALLTFPEEYSTNIVEGLVTQLPNSLSTCLALISNPSTHESLKKAFETWICSPNASSHTAYISEIEKVLKENFSGYGGVKCQQLCNIFISRETLKQMDEIRVLKEDLEALTMIDISHRNIISNRLSMAFLISKVEEILNLCEYKSNPPYISLSLEDSTLILSVLRYIVQLSDIASITPDSINNEEMKKLCMCLTTIDSSDTLLDAPLPLIECIFHLVLRALPCLSISINNKLSSLLMQLSKVCDIILPVIDEAVVKIRFSIPLLNNERETINEKVNNKELGEKSQEDKSTEQRRQSALTAMWVSQTMAQLCRIYKKKNFNINGEEQEEYLKKLIEEIATAARGIHPSWIREKEKFKRPEVFTTRPFRKDFTGGRREFQYSRQPQVNERGGVYRPPKRRRI